MNPLGNIKHGQHGTLTYRRWKSMRQRAAKTTGYYAAVECCARWASFDAFLADMGECPDASMTLDRIKNDLDYEPGNCQWKTQAEQNRNRSYCIQLTHNGITKNITDWAASIGIPANTLNMRIRLGWSIERALTQSLKSRGVSK